VASPAHNAARPINPAKKLFAGVCAIKNETIPEVTIKSHQGNWLYKPMAKAKKACNRIATINFIK
jgi:hypothetical protein